VKPVTTAVMNLSDETANDSVIMQINIFKVAAPCNWAWHEFVVHCDLIIWT